MNIPELSLKELSVKLHSRELTSVDVCDYYLQQIEASNPVLNAFISLCSDEAMQKAHVCDSQLDAGNAGTLTGIPVALKDLFCTQGIKTSCGSKMLDSFISPYDATITEKLRDAGMVNLGKTNMDQFAMGSTTENSWYGRCRHPFDHQLVPGGSSGGSAAAVAAKMIPAALGTDTGGSIRQPCALCGVTGIKPTYGRVSRYGMVAYASSLDQAGPMAKTAEDCALLLNAIAGYDPKDSTSVDYPLEDYSRLLERSIEGITLGLPVELLDNSALAPEVRRRVEAAIDKYRQLGASVVEVHLPHFGHAVACYYIIAMAEASSNLARFDGVRYGYRCQNPVDLNDLYTRSRSEGFSEEVQRRILIGTYVLSAGYYDAYYLKAQKIRRLIRNDFIKAFAHVDAIISPVTPYLSMKSGEQLNDPVTMYLGDLYTVPANLAGLPALSHPDQVINNTKHSTVLPVGIQLVGAHWNESTLLQLAHNYQQNP